MFDRSNLMIWIVWFYSVMRVGWINNHTGYDSQNDCDNPHDDRDDHQGARAAWLCFRFYKIPFRCCRISPACCQYGKYTRWTKAAQTWEDCRNHIISAWTGSVNDHRDWSRLCDHCCHHWLTRDAILRLVLVAWILSATLLWILVARILYATWWWILAARILCAT